MLDRRSAQLLVASVEHQAWIRSLRDHVHNHQQPPPSFIEEQCRLDMWLEDAIHGAQGGELVNVAYRLHEAQHELARQILAHLAHGEMSAVHDALADLDRMGEQLQAALDRLVEGV